MKVYMHYMPWFETPATIGKWGWHWTMNNKNPEIIENGKRQIASHFYPLIGPYASSDKDVIEYHFLLMKLSGIDGILINWYGVMGSNNDIKDLLASSDSIVSYTDDYNMSFAVVMEDRFSRNLDDVKANLRYLKEHYFSKPEYISYGKDNVPLVCIFGPITFEKETNWNEALPEAGNIEFLTLWYESKDVGKLADGEFMWVYQDSCNHQTHLDKFYEKRACQLKTAMAAAYPGFYDYYKEGGAGFSYFKILHNSVSTLNLTLNKAKKFEDRIDMLQLITFNDFGEGTMIEPTVETGFEYLAAIQKFTGVKYGVEELKLVHQLYILRKKYQGNSKVQKQLDIASKHLNDLEINKVKKKLDKISKD